MHHETMMEGGQKIETISSLHISQCTSRIYMLQSITNVWLTFSSTSDQTPANIGKLTARGCEANCPPTSN